MNHCPTTRTRRTFSAAAVAAAACITIAPPAIRTPVASADVAVCNDFGGTLNWGMRESFRKYLVGKIADGSWSTSSDVQTSGDFEDPSFYFGLDVRPGDIVATDSDTGEIPFAGEIEFKGHHGVLYMNFSDFKLKVDGTEAEITVDYVANKVDSFTEGAQPEEMTGDDVAIATVELQSPVDFTAGTVELAGTPVLTQDGSDVFIAYEAGQDMDPIGGEVGCGSKGASGTSAGTRSSSSSSASKGGKDGGTLGVLKETNEYFKVMNELLSNADKLIANTEKLANSATGGNRGGAGGTSGAGGTGGGAKTGGGTGAKPSGGTGGTGGGGAGGGGGAAGGGAGGARGAGGGGTDVCTADGSVGVVEAQGHWGVKQSFQSYITGSIAKGSWSLDGVDHSNGQFHFYGSSGAIDPGKSSGTILMPGSVHFTGHNGVLNLKISDLEIQFNGNSGSLIAQVSSSDMEGNHKDFGRVALANLNFGSLEATESAASGSASAFLTQAGSAAFAEFYPEGTELDPVRFTATLGGSASCAAGQGAGAAAGAAGSTGSGAAAKAAANAKKDSKSNAEKKTSGPGVAARMQGETGDQDSEGYAKEGNFKIKNANASSFEKPSFTTSVLLILAAFVVAGGSLSQLVLRHPASR